MNDETKPAVPKNSDESMFRAARQVEIQSRILRDLENALTAHLRDLQDLVARDRVVTAAEWAKLQRLVEVTGKAQGRLSRAHYELSQLKIDFALARGVE